jgi:uncharacterized protein (TIGR01777 family)
VHKVILAGGSGFLGRLLQREFLRRNFQPIVLTRRPAARTDGVLELPWDGRTPGDWSHALDGAAALVNLAGRNVNTRYTRAAKAEILRSRTDSVATLAAALRACRNPPPVWIQAASAAIYGNTGDALIDESVTPTLHPGEDPFSHDVCIAWENAVRNADTPATRRILLRIGFVLAPDGGALATLQTLVKAWLGGKAASGRQWMSWLHHADFTHLVTRIADDPATFDGTYLAISPTPVRNADFMRDLRRALHRSFGLPAPAFALPLACWLMRTEPELALRSRRCIAARLLAAGFPFRFPTLSAALGDLFARPAAS